MRSFAASSNGEKVRAGRPLLIPIPLLLLVWLGFPFSVSAQESATVKVLIEGVGDPLLATVRAYLSLEKPPSPFTEATLHQLYRGSEDEIEQALQAFGYYHPVIRSQLTRTGAEWVARFQIDPGPQVIVHRLDAALTGNGKEDEEFVRLVANLPIREGAPLLHEKYNETKKMIQNLAAERGYFDARFTTHRIELDLATNSASVLLYFDTGRRYRMGPVRFEQETFNPGFLGRFVPFQPGVPYHSRHLLALNKALADSNYFSNIEMRALREEAEDLEIPISVKLAPRRKHQFSVGLGYGTDTGPRGLLGWEERWVNSYGHRFNMELEASPLRQSLTADYSIPLRNPSTDRLHLNAGWREEDTVTSESRLILAGLGRSRQRAYGWFENLFLNYRDESFEVGDQTGDSQLILLGINWTRVSTDNRSDPRRGNRLNFLIQGTDPALGSDIRFLQGQARAKLIHPLGKARMIYRAEIGRLYASDFNELPASLRFFTGGDKTVRGYNYNSLGPRDETGKIIGGRNLLLGSAEMDYRILPKWSAALFYDIGNAFDRWDERMNQSVGAGARWFSPVGPIRVDIAYAFSEPKIVLRLHINMGPDL